MKLTIVSAISVAFMATASSVAAYEGHVERELIVGGETVASGTKTYVAGLRVRRDSESFCGGTLITPTHVLTASHCIVYGPHWVSIGEHYKNGTEIGEQIKIVSIMSHPNFTGGVELSNDFSILELQKPSKFKPVKLAAADDSDFKPEKMAFVMGWGVDAEANGTYMHELQRVDVPLVSDEACAAYVTADSAMVCAGGVANYDACDQDSGGPLIVESAGAEDVLVGVVSWAKDNACGREGYYGVYARVSSARAWIETITSGSCLS